MRESFFHREKQATLSMAPRFNGHNRLSARFVVTDDTGPPSPIIASGHAKA